VASISLGIGARTSRRHLAPAFQADPIRGRKPAGADPVDTAPDGHGSVGTRLELCTGSEQVHAGLRKAEAALELEGEAEPNPLASSGFTARASRPAGYGALRYGEIRGYVEHVIESFADAETAKVWSGRRSRRLPVEIQPAALRKLRMVNQARTLTDLQVPPGNRLEALKGERRGQHSIRINQQWRICFRWHEGTAHDVGIVDYHD
jgi:proteic killer suppression protein